MKRLLLMMCFLSTSVHAGKWYDVPASQVEHIRAEGVTLNGSSGGYILQYKTAFPGDVNCPDRDFAYIRKDDVLAREMYSTAMAAVLAGKKLKIYTTGCTSYGNVIQILGLYP